MEVGAPCRRCIGGRLFGKNSSESMQEAEGPRERASVPPPSWMRGTKVQSSGRLDQGVV